VIDYEPVATLEYFRIAAEAGNAEACFMVRA
jgi:TPR repeat protein